MRPFLKAIALLYPMITIVLGGVRLPAEAQIVPASAARMMVCQPIGKAITNLSCQPIGKSLTLPKSGTLTISASDLEQQNFALGLQSSAPGLLEYSVLVLETDALEPIEVESMSADPNSFLSWRADTDMLTAKNSVSLFWQLGSAYLGEQVDVDNLGNPVYSIASLYIDPTTISNPAAFANATFTIRAVAVPEPGFFALFAGTVTLGSALAIRRKRRI